MKIRCNNCNYTWEARKVKTKKRYRQCPKCYSYDLAIDEQNVQKEQASKPTIIEKSVKTTIENDPEILELKKELRKAELQKKIREINMPLEIEKKTEQLEKVVCRVMANFVDIYDYHSHELNWERCRCFYCDGDLELWKEKGILTGYRCKNCGRKFPY